MTLPRINWSHPLAKRLMLAWVPGVAEYNLANGTRTPYTNATAGSKRYAASRFGRHVSLLTAGGNYEWFDATFRKVPSVYDTGSATFALIPESPTHGTIVGDGFAALALDDGVVGGQTRAYYITGGTNRGNGATNLAGRRNYSLGYSAGFYRYRIYLDGKDDTAYDSGANAGWIQPTEADLLVTAGWGYTKSCALILHFMGELPASVFASLHANPWQMFEPSLARNYSFANTQALARPASFVVEQQPTNLDANAGGILGSIPISAAQGSASFLWNFDQRLFPSNIVTLQGLVGDNTRIDESVDSPDANWLTVV